MRILLLHGHYAQPPGGAEQYVARLGTSLGNRGHRLLLATRYGHSEVTGASTSQLSSIHPYHPGGHHSRAAKALWHAVDIFDPVAYTSLRSVIRRWRPDIVHSHNFQGMSGAQFALGPVPHLHTVHDFALVDPATTLMSAPGTLKSRSPLMRARTQALARLGRATTFLFPNPKTKELHATYGFVPSRSTVLPHGWDDPLEGGERPARPQELRFLFAGRLTDMKGVRLVLEAWGGGVHGATLTFAGTGDLHGLVTHAARRIDSIRYLGWVEPAHKRQLFSEHDVLVFPSLWPEVFPLVTVEAVRSGMPIIASTLSSPPVVDHGSNGLLVPSTVTAWREALHGARDAVDDYLRKAESLRQRWSWDEHVSQIESLYGRLAAG